MEAINSLILSMVMSMSHDMRSPLISLATSLNLLKKGMYGEITEGVKKKLDEMFQQAAIMLDMTEDYLGKAIWVQGDTGFRQEELDLGKDIIEPVLKELSSDIGERRILVKNMEGFYKKAGISIRGNRICWKSIFRNLIRNAIKHGDEGCTIGFELEDRESYTQVHFFNTGTPVPEECRTHLFDGSAGISNPNLEGFEKEGLGLGLCLVKEIIQKQGGDIWYEAQEEGSSFFFTFPHS